ncbi:MAG: vitamin K epoxide reductase family protein [Mycobacteriales bacterium]
MRLAWIYLIGGAIGLVAAFTMTVEKIEKLRNPGYVPSCSINPIISCGSVMDSKQAAAFGFPNSLIGIGAFAIVATVGLVMLCGFRLPRWFRLGLQLGAAFGVFFVHWLIYSSLYRIHALCPYCIGVWIVTTIIFWYTTLDNMDQFPRLRTAAGALEKIHTAVVVLWCAIIAGLILQEFWDYWLTLV